jgi:NAD+ diphosphatase
VSTLSGVSTVSGAPGASDISGGIFSRDSGDVWFLFKGRHLLLLEDESGQRFVPRIDKGSPLLPESPFLTLPLGEFDGLPCFALALKELPPEQPGLRWIETDMRIGTWELMKPRLYKFAGKGRQLAHWDAHSQFCPACGAATARERASFTKTCPACRYEQRPPIYVAIMVAVLRGDEVLLIRTHQSRGNAYGLVAGFLEPGENLEECVKREVMEETGLRVKNIRYHASQTWPLVSNLMVGFYADYEAGEIKLQEEELTLAAFFHRDNLPARPHPYSLNHQLITWWASGKPLPAKVTPDPR